MKADRRTVMALTAAAGAAAATRLSAAPVRGPTPPQEMGPFYPRTRAADARLDLTAMPGRADRARGLSLDLVVSIVGPDGSPLRGAMVLVWQADAQGIYGHPREPVRSDRAVDPAFRGHGLLRADDRGQVHVRTVRPGAYDDGPGRLRTPHIHFEVIGEEGRLVTQMYFPDEALNRTDRLLEAVRTSGAEVSSLIARPNGSSETGTPRLAWTVVLARP